MFLEEEINKKNHSGDKLCSDEKEIHKDVSGQMAVNELRSNGGNENVPCNLICNEAQKKVSSHLMLIICLSGAMFGFFVYRLFTENNPNVSKLEMFTCFFIFLLFLTIQIYSVKFYYNNQERRTFVRILTIFLLLWLGFNAVFAVFYFSKKQIPLIAVLLYPGFYVLFGRFLNFLGITSRPTRSVGNWFFNEIDFLRELRDYYSDDEMLYLMFLGFISLLSLFMIMSAYWSAAILTLFFVIVRRTIANYDPRKSFIYRKFIEGNPKVKSNPVPVFFSDNIFTPLVFFQGLGSGAFLYVFIYCFKWRKLPLSLQLSIWGACCWNLIMSEMYIYAVNVSEKIKVYWKK
jgi:hypothetical protein